MTPVAACLKKHSCLAYRETILRKPAVFTWNEPCVCCMEGFARRMDGFTPEPDREPEPVRYTGKPKKPPATCKTCGAKVASRATLCKKCWGLSRRVNHIRCGIGGCRWYARRGGMCHSHYQKALDARKGKKV